MSYIVQLPDNVRLFALNDDHGIEGDFLDWVKEQAEDALKNDQFIVAMTHHPIIPPSPMYELIGKGDMHRNYKEIRKQYADMGIQLMLTGHTHGRPCTLMHGRPCLMIFRSLFPVLGDSDTSI